MAAGLGSVFVSHTADLASYPPGRSFAQAVVEAVLKASLRPVDMGYFAAREEQPAEYCQRQVRDCDIYVAVIGWRYGSRVPDRTDSVSFTELEFMTATEARMPRPVFVLDESVRLPRRLVDSDRSSIDGFRRRLRNAGVIVKAVSTPAELGESVLHALYEERLSRLGGPPVASRRRPWMAPPLERMVGRPDLSGRLVAALTEPEASEVGLTTALQGAGGFGKTHLATWVCHQPEIDRRYPGGLLWVTVGQEVHGIDLAAKISALTFVLSGQRATVVDPDTAGGELGRLLDEREPVLLVVDDVWEDAQLRPFRIGGRTCTRLVTTRIPDLLPGTSAWTRCTRTRRGSSSARESTACPRVKRIGSPGWPAAGRCCSTSSTACSAAGSRMASRRIRRPRRCSTGSSRRGLPRSTRRERRTGHGQWARPSRRA